MSDSEHEEEYEEEYDYDPYGDIARLPELENRARAVMMGLSYAASTGDLESVRYMVENGEDVHEDEEDALRRACKENHIDVVEYLLEHDANPNAEDGKCMEYAIENDNEEMLLLLIRYGGDIHIDDNFLTVFAASQGNTNLLRVLMYYGADDFMIAMDTAIVNNNIEMVRMMLEGVGNSALGVSRASANYEFPNSENTYPPLYQAIVLDRPEIVKLLIENGADKEVPIIETALRFAREHNLNEVLEAFQNTRAGVQPVNGDGATQQERIQRARDIEAQNEAKRQAAIQERKNSSDNESKKASSWADNQCSNDSDLFGEELSEKKREDIVIIFMESDKGKGECLTKDEIAGIKQQKNVGLWEGPPSGCHLGEYQAGRRKENSFVFRLPWTGVWVTEDVLNEALKDDVFTVIMTRKSLQSIGSSFGQSNLHGQWGGKWGFEYVERKERNRQGVLEVVEIYQQAILYPEENFQPDDRYLIWSL